MEHRENKAGSGLLFQLGTRDQALGTLAIADLKARSQESEFRRKAIRIELL
jgi:hypothetical protein